MKLIFLIVINLILGSLGKPTENDGRKNSDEVIEELDEDKRIRGGSPATSKRFPYLVSLQSEVPEIPGRFSKYCGGSIITPIWILTAAHCCTHLERKNVANSTWARAGVIEGYATTTGYQLRKIREYFVHEGFNMTLKQHDICLMKVEKPFTFTSYVNKIDMAPNCQSESNRGFIAGYGKIAKDKHTDTLNFVEVNVIDFSECIEQFPKVRQEYHICPGEKGKGSCQGDSGGPFIQENVDGKPCLKGVASYGKKDCETGIVSVYIRPEAYADWLQNIINENS